jgi:hypothetical protein
MNVVPSRWRRLAAQSVSTLVNSPLFENVINDIVYDKEDLPNISNKTYTYTNKKELSLSRPVCIGHIPDEINTLCGKYSVPEWSVYEIQDVELVGPTGITISNDGMYILANSLENRQLLVKDIIKSTISGSIPRYNNRATNQIDLAVSLVGPWSTGYFHWFAQYLPQLEGINHFESITGEEPTVIVPQDPPKWLISSLSLLGFGPDRIREWNERRLKINRLIVPEIRHIPAKGGHIHDPYGINWVGNELSEVATPAHRNWPSQIYISRSDADERRITNEQQVRDLLSSHGYSQMILSEYSLLEQIEMFHQVDSVIGPHGAGLINTMYSNNVSITEVFGSYYNACYFTLSAIDEISYQCMVGEPVGSDIRVSETALTKAINK